ncbi:MAG: MotA/TolQ/ExbB proton channel family protein, partial [Bacteroidaceae bacterium]|nr:MotA/TolQ/ExbB proton channel family protein [Bacteroidaceae bacterium]
MKKFFAVVAMFGILSFGLTQTVVAQDAAAPQTETVDTAAVDSAAVDSAAAAVEEPAEVAPVEEETVGMHKALKTKFIEGDASFMSLVAIALVLGLAFCIERIIYLSLAEVNTKKLMAAIEAALAKGDVEGAKDICRNTRGPVASICYQGLLRIDEGIDVVERSVVSYGGVQSAAL